MKINFFEKRGVSFLSAFFIMITSMVFSQTTSQQVFNYTNGSVQTFTVPTGVASITVEVWGAGGAGGGGNNNKGFGGGGGGAYTRYIAAVTGGTTYNINVGKGGVSSGNAGATGGDSSFLSGNTIIVSAQGGTGGNFDARGLGGNSANGFPTSGSVRTNGGGGGTGANNGGSGFGGGGGGSGGSGGDGGLGTTPTGGIAGASNAAGSAGAAGGSGGTTTNSAVVGGIPGAGGGGNRYINTSAVGYGGNGRIVVTYVITNIDVSVTKSIDNPSPFAGDAVTFTLVAKNVSTLNTANNIVLTDLLPSGYTFISSNQVNYDQSSGNWKIGTMATNASTTMTITAVVNPTGIYTNTATIASTSQPDSVPGNNSFTVTPIVCKASPTAPQVKQ